MSSADLIEKFSKLSLNAQDQVEKQIDELFEKENGMLKELNNKSYRGYGSLKGKITMSEDFNEPLECFKDYI